MDRLEGIFMFFKIKYMICKAKMQAMRKYLQYLHKYVSDNRCLSMIYKELLKIKNKAT